MREIATETVRLSARMSTLASTHVGDEVANCWVLEVFVDEFTRLPAKPTESHSCLGDERIRSDEVPNVRRARRASNVVPYPIRSPRTGTNVIRASGQPIGKNGEFSFGVGEKLIVRKLSQLELRPHLLIAAHNALEFVLDAICF